MSPAAQGRGQNPKQYSSRYVCSLVADFHRTLIYGGWAANPREHLRLVYEANPLAFLAEQVRGEYVREEAYAIGVLDPLPAYMSEWPLDMQWAVPGSGSGTLWADRRPWG